MIFALVRLFVICNVRIDIACGCTRGIKGKTRKKDIRDAILGRIIDEYESDQAKDSRDLLWSEARGGYGL